MFGNSSNTVNIGFINMVLIVDDLYLRHLFHILGLSFDHMSLSMCMCTCLCAILVTVYPSPLPRLTVMV
jgi:hypothetical protein